MEVVYAKTYKDGLFHFILIQVEDNPKYKKINKMKHQSASSQQKMFEAG